MNGRLKQQLAFCLKLDEEKNIFRQTSLSHHGRKENDAEHAWHMAIMAYLLKEYANKEVDITKVMIMCLIHDVVEIEAGDTFAYDEEAKKTQKEREQKAAEHLFGILPEDQAEEFRALFDEFEEGKTMESRFAHAMDNFQPLMLNDSNDGSDWLEHDVSRSSVDQRHAMTAAGSQTIFEVTTEILDRHTAAGHIRKG
ncbi:MAG: HD domain-containing protein [Bulleidia sp.]